MRRVPVGPVIALAAAIRRPAALTLDRLERARCCDLPGKARRKGIDGELLACQALDVAQVAALLVRAEGDRDARRAGARSAPDAVDILLGNVGQIEIDDVADARNVD